VEEVTGIVVRDAQGERLARGDAAAPRRLTLTRRVRLGPDEIVLVTYDAEERRLTLKGPGAP